jgi:putative ATP-dependent endonuclease of the OLD family
VSQPIEIAVTFSDLGAEAKELFASYLEGEEITVERVFSSVEDKIQNKYYGSRLSIADFRPVYTAGNATEAKKCYQELDTARKYAGLVPWANRDQSLRSLKEWEESHPEQCSRSRDEGQFFGFTAVGQGYLGRYTRLIYVPAVRDAGSDAEEGRDSPVKEIVDLVVRNSLATHQAIRDLKDETKKRYDAIVDPSKMTDLQALQADLNRTLKNYVADANVELDWLPFGDIQFPLPKTDVTLYEDGYPCTVSRSGHGLQRAFILTMLQHLAVAKPTFQPSKEKSDGENAAEATAPEPSDLILCIEEPEVYQHPNRQRHFAAILMEIASGTIAGVAGKTQVIYSTHSPMFVGLDRFDRVRLFRKVAGADDKPKCAKASRVTMDQIAEELWDLMGRPGDKYSGATLLPRLQPIMTPWMNEGFFGDVVVLVEGEDDLAALVGVAKYRDISFAALGISVIPCVGKANLDRPTLIFRALGIPVFLLWDGDEGDAKKNNSRMKNRLLLRVMGEAEEDYPSCVKDKFACFKVNLEQTLKDELGDELFVALITELQDEFGVDSPNDCLKKPTVVCELIKRAKAKDKTCTTLESIVDKILALHSTVKVH